MRDILTLKEWTVRTTRLMVGIPDYQTYVEHRRRFHADQHSSGGLKARSGPRRFSTHVRRRRIDKRPDIVKTIPGRRATLRWQVAAPT